MAMIRLGKAMPTGFKEKQIPIPLTLHQRGRQTEDSQAVIRELCSFQTLAGWRTGFLESVVVRARKNRYVHAQSCHIWQVPRRRFLLLSFGNKLSYDYFSLCQ